MEVVAERRDEACGKKEQGRLSVEMAQSKTLVEGSVDHRAHMSSDKGISTHSSAHDNGPIHKELDALGGVPVSIHGSGHARGEENRRLACIERDVSMRAEFLAGNSKESNQVSRIQEQKQIINAEGTHNLLTLKATFSHPLMVTQLLEAVRSRNAIKAREQGYVHIELMNPTTDHLRDICARMPSDPEYYHKLSLKMSWGVDVVGVGRQDITYVGVEKRHMKPLIQIPTLSSSRAFRDACREYFSQYCVLRHEHAQR